MINLNLTRQEYEKLKKTAYTSDEGYLFRNPYNKNKIIKTISYLPWEPIYQKIKLYTISLLLENRDILSSLRISIPEELATIESISKGYQRTCIEGTNLSTELSNEKLSLDTRINYLIQVGTILRDMDAIRKNTSLKNFFYNDIHEDNFIVGTDGQVQGIDIDACSIKDNIPSVALYPSLLMEYISRDSKYQMCDRVCSYTTTITPDRNLDLYCYIRMILNFMYGKPIDNLDKDTLLEYLDFLEFYGGNQDFLYCLSRIYDDGIPNENPDYLLHHIKEIYPYSNIHYDKSGHLSKVLR